MSHDTYPGMLDDLPADTLVDGRYKIVRKIGHGGFAVVYLAEHVSLGRQVALKVLDLTGNQRDVAMFRTRFQREARLASQLDDPHIVRIHDFGFVSQKQQPYMAMELLEGHDLEEELLRFGPLTPERAKNLFMGALGGLAHAHDKGIVHKDLKPSNLFIAHPNTPQERMVVLDFGIAHLYEDPEGRLTQTNQYTGTPAYAAPEYINSQSISPALDVYQMGLIIGESLSGTPVVEASSPMAFLIAHCNGHQRIDTRLERTPVAEVVERAVQVDPAARYANATELRDAFAAIPTTSIPDLSGSGYIAKGSPKARAQQSEHALDSVPPAQHAMAAPAATQPMTPAASKLPLLFGAIAALCLLLIVPGVGIIAYAMLSSDDTTSLQKEGATLPPTSPPPMTHPKYDTSELTQVINSPEQWQKYYAKFGQIHQAQRFVSPIFELMIPMYLLQRQKYKDDLEQIAVTAPTDSRMLFESSHAQIMQALHSNIEQEELDSHLQAWRLRSEKMQPVMADLYYYWNEDKTWKSDEGLAVKKIDERLARQLEDYASKRDALNASLRKHEAQLLAQRKKMLGPGDQTAEREVIDALLALNALHTELLEDPLSKESKRAHTRYMDRYKIARRAAQRVEKPKGTLPYLGVDPHIENLRTYNKYVDQVMEGAESGASKLDMIGHYNWLHVAFGDTWTTYYTQTLNDRKMRALMKINAK